MTDLMSRRRFLLNSANIVGGMAVMRITQSESRGAQKELCPIALAEWSVHRALFAKTLDHLDFARTAKQDFGIEAVEYVNQFFKDKATDQKYLSEMKKRANDLGVRSVLIMIDEEGALGDGDENRRKKAVENHYKWVEAARFLG